MYSKQVVHGYIHPELKENIWCCNIKHVDVDLLCIQNNFWADVLRAWAKIHYVEDQTNNPVIWLNSDYRVGGLPVFWSKPYQNGLFRVSDLMDGDNIMTEQAAIEKYELTVMQYNAIVSVIPRKAKLHCAENGDIAVDDTFREMMHNERPAHYAYTRLTKPEEAVRARQEKWCEELLVEVDLRRQVKNIKFYTEVVKYRSFQYRLLMRAIVTNVQLKKWSIIDSSDCTFGCKETETV